jgi:hypothetical protein
MTLTAVAHADADLLPSDAELKPEQRRMFLIERDDFKKCLETEGDWPLPRENLLSRWWSDIPSDKKVDTFGVGATVSAENIFKKEGQMWTLRFGGIETHLKHSKGLLYISYLLGSPYQEYHVAELVRAAGDPAEKVLNFSSGEVSSKETIANYRKRLLLIRTELKDASDKGDSLLKKELKEEKLALEKQLLQALGMRGKLKKNPDETKRQANAVSEAISRSFKTIDKIHPTFWRHLFNAINRGEYLSYTPETDISWITTQ